MLISRDMCEAGHTETQHNQPAQMMREMLNGNMFLLWSPRPVDAGLVKDSAQRCFFRIKGKLSHVTSHSHGGTPAANMTCMAKFFAYLGRRPRCRSRTRPA